MVCLDILLIGALVWLLSSGALGKILKRGNPEEVKRADLPSHEALCESIMAGNIPNPAEDGVWFFSGSVMDVTRNPDRYCIHFSASPADFELEDRSGNRHAFSVNVSIHTTAPAAGALARDQVVQATGRISNVKFRTEGDGPTLQHWVDVEMPASDWRVGE